MYCPKCCKEIENAISFCPLCGTRMEDRSQAVAELPIAEDAEATIATETVYNEAPEETVAAEAAFAEPIAPAEEEPEKKKSKKGRTIAIAIICGLVVLGAAAGFFYYNWYNAPEQQLERALAEEDYDEAAKIYVNNFKGSTNNILIKKLGTRLDNVKADFIGAKIDKAATDMELSSIESTATEINAKEILTKISDVKSFVEELNTSRIAFEDGEKFLADEDYKSAIEQFKKVISADKNWDSAKKKLSESIDKFRESAFADAKALEDSKDYLGAISVLKKALDTIPDDTKINNKIDDYEDAYLSQMRAQTIADAKSYADQGDYIQAMETIELLVDEGDTEAVSLNEEFTKKYIKSVEDSANAAVKEKNYDKAISIVEKGLETLPENDSLTALLAKIEKAKPVSLSSLKAINGGWKWNEGVPIDPFDNDYTGSNNFVIFNTRHEWSSKAEYRVYGDYTKLTGTLVPYTNISENGECQIQIYVDDELKYTSPIIGRKTDPVDFSVDISGGEYVKIVCKGVNNDYYACNAFILMNTFLWTE